MLTVENVQWVTFPDAVRGFVVYNPSMDLYFQCIEFPNKLCRLYTFKDIDDSKNYAPVHNDYKPLSEIFTYLNYLSDNYQTSEI